MRRQSQHPGRHKLKGYVSEFGEFLNSYMEQHPEVEEDQKRGWKIWWDHRIDLDEMDRQRQDTVPLKPYIYE
jgi:hypothetical protein